jgi:hypothetical protein|mmetsp:Transcript_12320/g.18943  ORF Transcript_12320/g.18943 Transcript_12320/m.18943 type:complete len:118 (-) Transcript_12320:660-1013(-)
MPSTTRSENNEGGEGKNGDKKREIGKLEKQMGVMGMIDANAESVMQHVTHKCLHPTAPSAVTYTIHYVPHVAPGSIGQLKPLVPLSYFNNTPENRSPLPQSVQPISCALQEPSTEHT